MRSRQTTIRAILIPAMARPAKGWAVTGAEMVAATVAAATAVDAGAAVIAAGVAVTATLTAPTATLTAVHIARQKRSMPNSSPAAAAKNAMVDHLVDTSCACTCTTT